MQDTLSTLEIVTKARHLIEQGWCKNALARRWDGVVVPVGHKDACQFCMGGAVGRVAHYDPKHAVFTPDRIEQENRAIAKLEQKVFELHRAAYLAVFNDSRNTTKDMVLRVFDEVIKELS